MAGAKVIDVKECVVEKERRCLDGTSRFRSVSRDSVTSNGDTQLISGSTVISAL